MPQITGDSLICMEMYGSLLQIGISMIILLEILSLIQRDQGKAQSESRGGSWGTGVSSMRVSRRSQYYLISVLILEDSESPLKTSAEIFNFMESSENDKLKAIKIINNENYIHYTNKIGRYDFLFNSGILHLNNSFKFKQ